MVRELLAPLGPISTRRMFGGAGIYCDGVMLALVEDDVLYFKADAATRARYEAEYMSPFTFEGQTRPVATSYWRAPDRLYDEPDDLLEFAREAMGVAASLKSSKHAPRAKASSKRKPVANAQAPARTPK